MTARAAFALSLVVAFLACDASKSAPPPASTGPAPNPYADLDAASLPTLPDGGIRHAIAAAELPPTRVLYAASDIHGGWDRFAALLAAVHLTTGVPPTPDAITWAAADAILVVTGDLIDKGPQGLEVIDGLRALGTSAASAGGEVIVLIGNHEAEFFVDPKNSKASDKDGFDAELAAQKIDPAVVATGAEPRGAWLRTLPLAARVGSWFFSHAGNTKGRSFAEVDLVLRSAIGLHPDYDDPEIVGSDSILEARGWYDDPGVAPANAAALGVKHIVFGHDPNAIGARGAIGTAQGDLLYRIDCGMTPSVNDSTGCVLRVRREGAVEIAEELLATGAIRELGRGSP